MSTLVYFDGEPSKIQYMAHSNGTADVWLRQNIEEYTTEENTSAWKADEVYFKTYFDEDYVTENFDTLWEGGEGDNLGTDDEGVVNNTVSIEDRVAALEASYESEITDLQLALAEICELVVGGETDG